MAAQNQDFVTYAGDSPKPIFTVVGPDGSTPVDISLVTEIVWTARRSLNDAPVLTKSKTGGSIAFVTNGSNGQFQVTIAASDTAGLTGWYMHYAALTDAAGGITTVEVGRMMVGQTPNWTYDDGSAATNDIYLVRDMIGDTTQSDQLLSDQTIFTVLQRWTVVELAAAECCRFIAAKFSRQVDTATGALRNNYSQRVKNYMMLNNDLLQLGYARGGVQAYAGGISVQDKINFVEDTDRVPPNFMIAMFDNLLPESPVGHQANSNLGEPQDMAGLTGIIDG